MSAPVQEPDGGPPKDGPLSYAPKRARLSELAPEPVTATPKTDATPQRGSQEAPEPPWRRLKRRDAFSGDVAIADLRKRLATEPDCLPHLPSPVSGDSKFALVGRLAGVCVVATVGVVGYRWGSAPVSPPQLALVSKQSGQEGLALERSVSAAYVNRPTVNSPAVDSKLPAVQPAASRLSTGMAVDDPRSTTSGVISVGPGQVAYPPQPEPALEAAAGKPTMPSLSEQRLRDAAPSRAGARQLTVDAVQVRQTDEPARLTISAADAGASVAVVIAGLAPGSALSAGIPVGQNMWRLSAEEFNDAAITPPRGFVGGMDLTLELRLADNTVADRKGVRLEWSGKSVLVPARPQPRRLDASEVALIVKNGGDMMANGDVAAARMMYQRAAEAGAAVAAFALAETYDPLVLKKLNARGGITPDVALAHAWYEKAKDLGSAVAPERLERLARLPE